MLGVISSQCSQATSLAPRGGKIAPVGRSGLLPWLLALSFTFAALFPPLLFAAYVEVTKTANVYSDSSRIEGLVLQSIDPAAIKSTLYLPVIGTARENGYFNVRLPDGRPGWIYKTRVRHFDGALPGSAVDQALATSVYGGLPNDGALGDEIKHLKNDAYSVGYSETKLDPLWVAFRVPATNGEPSCTRSTRFATDDRTDAKVTHNDYTGTGYDRGHMAPNSAIGAAYGCEAQAQTFLTSNIVPQTPGLNQKAWAGFEGVVQNEYANEFEQVWVLTGPIFDPEEAQEMCSGVEIPIAFYKIVVREVNKQPDAIAIVMEQDTPPGTKISALTTTIDDIEQRTGIDFFPSLSPTLQKRLEGTKATDQAWKLETGLDTSFPGTPRDFCVTKKHKRSDPAFEQ